jgi:ketosteroid isomerase-like protein
MADNVQTVREGYEAFGRGDLQAATENWADDVQWENPNTERLPNPGVHEGKDAVIQNVLAATQEYWDDFRITPDEFIDGGDTVVVLSHIEARGKETGNQVKVPAVHIFRMRDGTVTRVQALTDTAMTADALGR